MNPWSTIDPKLCVGLNPWVWVQLESAEPPGPFPFLGGVAPDVVNAAQRIDENTHRQCKCRNLGCRSDVQRYR